MKPICLALLVSGLLLGCANQPAERPAAAATQAARHRLNWEGYDGTGDTARTLFLLDGQRLGQGAAGLDALRQRIARMPRGSQIVIEPYYGDPGRKLRYPFDESDLKRWADQQGVALLVPSAG